MRKHEKAFFTLIGCFTTVFFLSFFFLLDHNANLLWYYIIISQAPHAVLAEVLFQVSLKAEPLAGFLKAEHSERCKHMHAHIHTSL